LAFLSAISRLQPFELSKNIGKNPKVWFLSSPLQNPGFPRGFRISCQLLWPSCLSFLDFLDTNATPTTLEADLKQVATELTDWIAADWVAWEFDKSFQPPSRRIGSDDPKKALRKYTETLKEKVVEATQATNVEVRFDSKRLLVEQMIQEGSWLQRLPGKQLLRRFLVRFPTLRPDDYLRAAASVIRERNITVDEFVRLRDTLLNLPGAKGK
jgi:hypothetical protein